MSVVLMVSLPEIPFGPRFPLRPLTQRCTDFCGDERRWGPPEESAETRLGMWENDDEGFYDLKVRVNGNRSLSLLLCQSPYRPSYRFPVIQEYISGGGGAVPFRTRTPLPDLLLYTTCHFTGNLLVEQVLTKRWAKLSIYLEYRQERASGPLTVERPFFIEFV